MWPKPKENFGTLLTRYMERKGMELEDLPQALQTLGYARESVHPGVMLNAITDSEGYRWRNNPVILKGIEQVLDLDSEKIFQLTNAYLYRPPEQPRRRRRR